LFEGETTRISTGGDGFGSKELRAGHEKLPFSAEGLAAVSRH
jgi:hypothetical protein